MRFYLWDCVTYCFVNLHNGQLYTLSGIESQTQHLPYFLGYKTEFFSFQNNPKVLDPSCKTDLELWHCLGRVELVL